MSVVPIRPTDGEAERALVLDLDGYEGPIDVLLALAREQKVDLAKISILALADQYLAFIAAQRRLRLEIAADYLVMAAWLAYLKSRLLLPSPPKEADDDAADLAERLAERLRRLETIRRAADLLMKRPQLGRDVFARGAPESIELPAAASYTATLYDLISAYARQSQKRARTFVRMKPRQVWSLADAREALGRLIGRVSEDWVSLDGWLVEFCFDPKLRRSARASSFSASLELVREGLIELKQEAHFAPLYLRKLERDESGPKLALVES
jgi:segregation and condensation protein A